MNTALQTSTYNAIKNAVSAITSNVYWLHLPSDDLLNTYSVTYGLNNSANESTFDSPDATRTYSLRINLNAPSADDSFRNLSIYIRDAVYRLSQTVENVRYVRLVTEDAFFDPDLEVYTEFQQYEIQYS